MESKYHCCCCCYCKIHNPGTSSSVFTNALTLTITTTIIIPIITNFYIIIFVVV